MKILDIDYPKTTNFSQFIGVVDLEKFNQAAT